MNRRSFLTSLVALPVVGLMAKSLEATPEKKVVPDLMYNVNGLRSPWTIMTPTEINEAGFIYVNMPVFMLNGTQYCVKTCRLNLWMDFTRVEAFKNNTEDFYYKGFAIVQIRMFGLTHVHSVEFSPYPTYNVMTGKPAGHFAFVRGATVKV